MPKFRVHAAVTGTKYLGEFEAATAEEAAEKALNSEAASVCLCHQCNDECEDPQCEEAFAELVEED